MRWVLAGLLLGMALGACSGDENVGKVEYRVEGTACSADITYENKFGNFDELEDVSLPWNLKFNYEDGQFAYLFARNQCNSGTVTVEIHKDGNLVERATTEQPYGDAVVWTTL